MKRFKKDGSGKEMIVLDMNEFEIGFRKYKDSVFRMAFAYCKNKSDADDISQDVFLKYYRGSPRFESEKREKAWLMRVTINSCKDLMKSAWRSRRSELDENSAGEYLADDDYSYVFDAVARLPKKYRAVIHLYYYEELSVSEISEITDIKPSTVQTQLQRGRKLLEKMLKEDGYEQSGIQSSI